MLGLLLALAWLLPGTLQAQFTFITNNGTITITGSSGNPTSLNIPSTINGYPVTSIADYAFNYGESLRSVTLPNTVSNIGFAAFINCYNLTNIALPDGLAVIQPGTFGTCSSLPSVVIPDTVTHIESWQRCVFHGAFRVETAKSRLHLCCKPSIPPAAIS